MSEKVLIKNQYDENRNIHGYWEFYIYEKIWSIENYFHGKPKGYFEYYHFLNGQIIRQEYYL